MIEVSNLSVEFGGHRIINELTLSIQANSFVLVVGPNGAGKTTFLDQFSALDEPAGGTITIDGVDVYKQPAIARSSIGRVFESPADQLIGATVFDDVAFGPENLGLSPDTIERRVRDSLEAVGMEGSESQATDSLSGGEAARVAIAGALAMQPSYLVLDEPTAGLDHRGRQRILEQLQASYAAGVGIILATHDLRDLVGIADRVVGLARGEIVFDDSPMQVIGELERIGVRVPNDWTRG